SRNFTMSFVVVCAVPDCAWANFAPNTRATTIASHTGILPFITRLDMKSFLGIGWAHGSAAFFAVRSALAGKRLDRDPNRPFMTASDQDRNRLFGRVVQ